MAEDQQQRVITGAATTAPTDPETPTTEEGALTQTEDRPWRSEQ